MERHVEEFLHKISMLSIAIATMVLLFVYLQTPPTCISPDTPITKPHLKFPSSTCDPSLSRPHLSLDKKNHRLWSSNRWLSHVASFAAFFRKVQSFGLLHNHSKVLCASAGAGHEVRALMNMGVGDVTGVELVDFLPLVRRADPNNLPFFDGAFDLAFTARLVDALFPFQVASEMQRTVRRGGFCVVMVEAGREKLLDDVIAMFNASEFVRAVNVTLIGMKMTGIIVRVAAGY